jgi:uncharacterized protein YacL
MSTEFLLRLIGMLICTILGAWFGIYTVSPPPPAEVNGLVFGLVGSLVGLILTPYLTTRPARVLRRVVLEMPAEVLVTSLIGLVVGLVIAALFAVPLGLLPQPFSQWLPTVVAIGAAYLGVVMFGYRAEELFSLARRLVRSDGTTLKMADMPSFNEAQILIDSSAIIDGRLLDISKTGFLSGQLIVPSFVLQEIQHIADESNPHRRERGKRGLDVLEEMKRFSKAPINVSDIDVEGIREVDQKLVTLAKQMNAFLLTTDHNLNRIAQLQGVHVLNVNDLTNAVKAVYLPGEMLALTIIAEGREAAQGVGYLADGTMVVVENGRRHLDRTIDVVISRMIQTTAGKMYFARFDETPRK